MKISTLGLLRTLKEVYVEFYGPIIKHRSIKDVVGQQTILIPVEVDWMLTTKK